MANSVRALKMLASLQAQKMETESVSSYSSYSTYGSEEKVVVKEKKMVPKKVAPAKTKPEVVHAPLVHPGAVITSAVGSVSAPKQTGAAPAAPHADPAVKKPRAKKLTKKEEIAVSLPQAPPPAPVLEPEAPKSGRVKKIKRAPSAYNSYVGKLMKEGKSMKEASAAWKASKDNGAK